MSEPIKQCCKDWIEVNDHQAERIAELEKERDELKVSMFEISSIIKSNSRFNRYTKARWANIDSEGLGKLSNVIINALRE
jgi:hypothetical protein